MKESVLYPYPFPCYLVDREAFADKVKSDKSWIKDHSKVLVDRTPIEEVVDAMYLFIRLATKDKQRSYFHWDERIMYIQEEL